MSALVGAELRKITSTRLWWALLIGALLFTTIQSVANAVVAGMEAGPGTPAMPGLDTAEAVRSVYASAMFSGTYIFAFVLGITGMTGEYRYQTITSTFLVSPRRTRVVVAKILAHAGVGAVYGLAGGAMALVAGGTTMTVRGYGFQLGADRLWVTLGLAVLAVAIWAVLGIGVGTLIRNQVAAIVTGVAITFLVEPLVTYLLAAADLDSLVKWLPSNASSALMAPGNATLSYLDWWVGGLVLLGYGILLAGLGVLISVRRDVS